MASLKIVRSLLRSSKFSSVNPPRGEGAISLLCIRHASSINSPPQLMNQNLSFRPAFDSPIAEENRPLVLLYSWLVAKSKHMSKYSDFYLGKGFDVMHIKIQPMQLVWPKQAQRVVSQLLDFVVENRPHQSQPVVVHGFSVGGYLYGETLVKILKTETEKYGAVGKRIVGQILDSPVDFEGIPYGMSRAVTENRISQVMIQGSMELYLTLLKNQTMKHYLLSSGTFKENALELPTLLLYARNDKIAYTEPIEKTIQDFSARNIPVFRKMWENSKHVSHFHLHPVEYIEALNMFLDRIGLVELEDGKLRMHGMTGQ